MRRVLVQMPSETHFGVNMIQGLAAFMDQHESWQLEVPGTRGWKPKLDLADWDGDGVILPVHCKEDLDTLHAKQIPFVNITAYPVLPTVQNDNRAMGRLSAEYFLSQGFQHFAWISKLDTIYGLERKAGFKEALSKRRVTPSVFEQNFSVANLKNFLVRLPRPCALQLCTDMQAPLVYQAANELGLDIPGQLSVMGMEDDILGLTLLPPLSSIQPNGYRIGYEVGQVLRDLFLGKPVMTRPLLIPPLGIAARKSGSYYGYTDSNVSKALAYIRAHAQQGMLVEQVLDEVGLSRRNLERRFQDAVGHSLWREMRRVQIEHVKNLLRGTRMPIKAVARESAFPQPSRFSQVFREETGETPAEYRKRNLLDLKGETNDRWQGDW